LLKLIKINYKIKEKYDKNKPFEEKQLYLDYKVFLLDLFVDEIFSINHQDKNEMILDQIFL